MRNILQIVYEIIESKSCPVVGLDFKIVRWEAGFMTVALLEWDKIW